MIWKVLAAVTKPRERFAARRKERRDAARALLHEAMGSQGVFQTNEPGRLIETRVEALMREAGIDSPFPSPRMVEQERLVQARQTSAWKDVNVDLSPTIGPDGKAIGCPDGGVCSHHGCESIGCFRVQCCAPLSGVFPGNVWPKVR